MKKKVFVSFDFENDKALKEFIVGQSRNPDSPFEVMDWSMKEAAPESDWEAEARHRIYMSDVVLVMVGRSTYRAPGVRKEVRMANAMKKPIHQIVGYQGTNPTPVPNAGPLIQWNWPNLKRLLS
ncbi:MAG: hypothetical protein CVT63_05775 [Candidatus Anoxymicrobium japonicum]|uniref:Thoeris protein ThsB TIR-like domain-containing protein n=1 Tax=Candidatus Anoxymicrobium japonicum TaxID=2013648 RepID=A0A2N3G5K7_9ACTN|nr:MAG: hypothetical protein CVT63_05775 [Candidatus Anoxymicrobium japonicum]